MEYATIWKAKKETGCKVLVEYRHTFDLSAQPEAHAAEYFFSKVDAKNAIARRGAKLWN